MLSEEKGHIFVGQATQWKDMSDLETVMKAPSGYYSGFDWINTCMHCAGPASISIAQGNYVLANVEGTS